MLVICKMCGSEFNRRPAHLRKYKECYCSFKCKGRAQSLKASPFKGRNHSKATKAILSQQHTGMKATAETKRKMSLSRKGRRFSDEHRKRISEALKGQLRSQEHCKNISLAKQGICHLSPETIERFKTQFKGAGNPFYGKTHSFATRQIIIQKNYERDCTFKETSIEIKMQNALSAAGVVFEKQKRIYGLPDLFIAPNVCIFCDGDYYHANPKQYAPGRIVKNKRADQVWEKDNRITVTLELMGYKVLRFWETDINENLEACIEQIKQAIGVEQVICR